MSVPATFTVEAPLLPVLTLTTGNLYYNSTRYTKDYATLTIYTNKLATYSITGDFVTSPLTGSLNGIFTGNLTLTSNDGTKTLSVYVSDGFVSTGKQFSVMLDTTAPTLPTLSTPLSGSILTGTFTLDWSDSTDT
jgi:hypothetical protein